MKKLIITLSILLTATVSFAQVSNVMYSSTRVPQINALNPAFFPNNNKLYIALPGINPQLQSPLSFNDIFRYDSVQQQTNIDLNHLVSSLAENGDLNLDANIHLVGLGLRMGKGFFTVHGQIKMASHLGIPKGLMTFLNEGNYDSRGTTLELVDGGLLNAQAYTEIAFGYGREIIDGLTIGARAKLLNGLANASTSGSSLTLYTAEDLSSIQAKLATQIQYASCLTMDENHNITGVNPLTNNWGWGFDLGARYQMGMFDFSASVLDMGKGIHWVDNVKTITSANENNTFVFEGIDLSGLISGGTFDTNMTNMLVDSLTALLDYKTVDGQDYWTKVPTKLNASVMVQPINMVRAGILFHGEIDHFINAEDTYNKLRSNTTLLGNVNLNDWVEVMLSASIVGDGNQVSWFNPGIGVNLSILRMFQIYGMVDYISNMRLVEAKSLNMSVGLNLLLGNTKDK